MKNSHSNQARVAGKFLVRKPLMLALASLALSAVALPAAAANWWSATPNVRAGSTTTINVRNKGALGNGVHDDTAAFQAAVDALPAAGGTVYVPGGRYMIDAVKSVRLRSHMRLLMASTAELDVIPNSASRSYAIKVWKADGVRIVGGRIIGDRVKHIGTTGEWGYGINISGSTNVIVKNTYLADFWGDGVLVGGLNSGTRLVRSDYVTLNNVVSTNNRRQGLTIGPAQHVYVVNSTFSNSNGTLPEAGIDIEPQTQGPVNAVRIENTLLSGNRGNGLELHANISDIVLTKSTMKSNHGFGVLAVSAPYLTITANTGTLNGLSAVGMSGTTHNVSITSNVLTSNSVRYISPLRTGGDSNRDLQISPTTWAITVANNQLSK